MATKCVDSNFRDSLSPVIALVEDHNATYVICRGEAAAAEVRNHLQDISPVRVTSSEAYRAIPDAVKAHLHISSDSIVKLPETTLGESVLMLTQDAGGAPNHFLVSETLSAAALKAASRKR